VTCTLNLYVKFEVFVISSPLDLLLPVTVDEVEKVSSQTSAKSSPLDYIPTSLIKLCSPTFSKLIAYFANLSFHKGCFPSSFTQAIVTPLLKKPGLDSSSPSNYRPISNLNNISKILERLFLTRLQPHVTSTPNFNPLQSAYRRAHSTETALVNTLDYIYTSDGWSLPTILVSLDLSAAFDTTALCLADWRIVLQLQQFGISSHSVSGNHYLLAPSNIISKVIYLPSPASAFSTQPHQCLRLCALYKFCYNNNNNNNNNKLTKLS